MFIRLLLHQISPALCSGLSNPHPLSFGANVVLRVVSPFLTDCRLPELTFSVLLRSVVLQADVLLLLVVAFRCNKDYLYLFIHTFPAVLYDFNRVSRSKDSKIYKSETVNQHPPTADVLLTVDFFFNGKRRSLNNGSLRPRAI